MLLVTARNYLAKKLILNDEPGVYEVVLDDAHFLRVRLQNIAGGPIPDARVLVYKQGVDADVWNGSSSEIADIAAFQGDSGFCVQACDADGVAIFSLPPGDYGVVPSALGFAPTRSLPLQSPVAGEAREAVLFMADLWAARLDTSEMPASSILGTAISVDAPAREWEVFSSLYARLAIGRARESLGAGGFLAVIGDRYAIREGVSPPHASVACLVAGVGWIEQRVELARFAEGVQPQRLRLQQGQALGELVVDDVPGVSREIVSQNVALYAEPPSGGRGIRFSVEPGWSYSLPIGKYSVMSHCLRDTQGKDAGKEDRDGEHLTDVVVRAGATQRVHLPPAKLGWPLDITVRYKNGTAPPACWLSVEDESTGRVWRRGSPGGRTPTRLIVRDGLYSIEARIGGYRGRVKGVAVGAPGGHVTVVLE